MILDEKIKIVLRELRDDGSRTHHGVLVECQQEINKLRIQLRNAGVVVK